MIGISIKSSVNSPDVFYKQQKKPFQRVLGKSTNHTGIMIWI